MPNVFKAANAPTPEDMALINQYTQKPLTEEEVYTFALRLCDNEVDRDYERFTAACLQEMAPLFVGKPGLLDHSWSTKGQTARIYKTEVVQEKTTTTSGEPLFWLKAMAYIPRSEDTKAMIDSIESGIRKEISVGLAVGRRTCSICGSDDVVCGHYPGSTYNGELCYRELQEPKDAYEWSFVAVPAQKDAGVIRKQLGGDDRHITSGDIAAMTEAVVSALRKEALPSVVPQHDPDTGTNDQAKAADPAAHYQYQAALARYNELYEEVHT